jgi:uncharacterized BrkB/YihY/UPF0761 family membrane protein
VTGHGPAARLRRLQTRAQARIEHEREHRYVVALAFTIVETSRRTAASILAGALAFRVFLTLLPLTLVVVVGLGFLKSAGGAPSEALKQFGIKGVLASTIDHSSDFSDPGRTAALVLGLFATLSGARSTARTLRAIHALAWGVPLRRWRRNGTAMMAFLIGVIVTLALAGLATRVRVDNGLALGLGASVLIGCGVAVIWLATSWVLPHRDVVGWRELLPGALLVGVGFALVQAVTADYIGPKLDKESKLYGSLGVSLVILGWLYIIGLVIVAAPVLNASLIDSRAFRSRRPPSESAEPQNGEPPERPDREAAPEAG